MSDPTPSAPLQLDFTGRATTFPADVPIGMPLFPPLSIERGLLVTGSPSALFVLQVVDGEALESYATIPAQLWITGFAYFDGGLYVQDGCVLSLWDFVQDPPVCTASRNLLTGKTCDGAPTADVLQLDATHASKQQALLAARQRLAWGTFLEAAEALSSPPSTEWIVNPTTGVPRQVQTSNNPVELDDLLSNTRRLMGSADPSQPDPSLTVAELRTALAAAQTAAASVVFSAPVVRMTQFNGVPSHTVFVLGGDGILRRLDDALKSSGVLTHSDTAAVPVLAASEPADPNDPGASGLFLFYAAANGTVRIVNADTGALAHSWSAQGAPPDPATMLPLAVRDGVVWGGGVLGADFFAVPATSPAWAPVLDVAASGGVWTGYEVEAADQLALVTDGVNGRLGCYAAGAGGRDRWGAYAAPSPAWTAFWPEEGAEFTGSRLVLEIERSSSAAAGIGFSVYAANTVDDPLGVVSFPPPAPVAAGTLSGPPPTLATVLASPVLAGGSLYLVGADTLAEQITALYTVPPQQQGWTPPLSPWVLFLSTSLAPPVVPTALAGIQTLPPAGDVSAFVCSLAGLTAASVADAAKAYLAQMTAIVDQVALQVSVLQRTSAGIVTTLVANAAFWVGPDDESPLNLTSNAEAVVLLPAAWAGRAVVVNNQETYSRGTSAVLVAGELNQITLGITYSAWSAPTGSGTSG